MLRMSRSGPLLTMTGFVFGLLGLVLLAGGGRLLLLGGSPYYLIAAAGLVVTGILLINARREALWLYALLLVGSTLWAVAEVRFDGWQLLPRLDVWFVLGLWLSLPFVNCRLRVLTDQRDARFSAGRWALASALGLVAVVAVGALLHTSHDLSGDVPATQMSARGSAAAPFTAPNDWTAFGRSGFADRYAPARQITPQNVQQLQAAWSFPVDDSKGAHREMDKVSEVTPLKANGMLYLCTPRGEVVALDPDTGKPRWRFKLEIPTQTKGNPSTVCSGIVYHDSGAYFEPDAAAWLPAPSASAAVAAPVVVPKGAVAVSAIHFDECPRRIFAAGADASIVAINADTGKVCESFGDHGAIKLHAHQLTLQRGLLNTVSLSLATQHVLIARGEIADDDATREPSGVLRGYDVDSGKLLWSQDASTPAAAALVPADQHNGFHARRSWGAPSVDEKLGLVYLAKGHQRPSRNGQSDDAIVALDVTTGQQRWAYQTAHHDAWTISASAPPNLLNLDTSSGKVPALLVSTERGDIYVLDRRDGKLLVQTAQRAAPEDAAAGDAVAATYPFSASTYAPKALRERDMWGVTPFDQLMCRITFEKYRDSVASMLPLARGSVIYPSDRDVFGQGGIAIDPVRQLALLNLDYMASVAQLRPRGKAQVEEARSKTRGWSGAQLHPMRSPLRMPCQAPPWGYVAALNLKTMQTVWMHKNVSIDAAFGVRLSLGRRGSGSPLTTGGGVTFLGGTVDHDLRAYDVRNGKLLWKSRSPASSESTPISYVSDKTGRQYVAVMIESRDSPDDKTGDSLVAYALPMPPHTVADGK